MTQRDKVKQRTSPRTDCYGQCGAQDSEKDFQTGRYTTQQLLQQLSDVCYHGFAQNLYSSLCVCMCVLSISQYVCFLTTVTVKFTLFIDPSVSALVNWLLKQHNIAFFYANEVFIVIFIYSWSFMFNRFLSLLCQTEVRLYRRSLLYNDN